MPLSTAQIAILKTAIAADVNVAAFLAAGATGAIQNYYNTAGSFVVWSTGVNVSDIYDKIVWANMTPADVPDATATWTNRALSCQGKQFNIQTLLQGRQTLDATKANLRAGLQDALTNIPSGVGGALVGGGWAAVNLVLQRMATNAEKLFATGTGTTASPGLLVFQGAISDYDVIQAIH